MKHLLSILSGTMLLLILLVACATSVASPTTISPTHPIASPTHIPELQTSTPTTEPFHRFTLEEGQIISQALADNLIGDPNVRDFMIYLPPSYYNSDKQYPVFYALHGYEGDKEELMLMALDLERLIESGEVNEMIIVFVDGSNKLDGSWYLSSPTIGDYESYIVTELVSHVDSNYRTISDRDSRGITGCSMGGTGSIHLALKYPGVFSVAVPMSGIYDYERDPAWDVAKKYFWRTPEDFDDFDTLRFPANWLIAGAAATASNPDNPPFYLDMPLETVNGEVQIVPGVRKKVNRSAPVQDVQQYLNQPFRLEGLMIYHGEYDGTFPVDHVRDFDQMLTELGVEHEYVEVKSGHCGLDYQPVLQFMSDQLKFS